MTLTDMKGSILTDKTLSLISLFSGCGGIDLGFEGDFRVLERSVNPQVNGDWSMDRVDDDWVRLGKTRFHAIFANDIKPEAKAAWTNYFGKRGAPVKEYHLDSIVDLVK